MVEINSKEKRPHKPGKSVDFSQNLVEDVKIDLGQDSKEISHLHSLFDV